MAKCSLNNLSHILRPDRHSPPPPECSFGNKGLTRLETLKSQAEKMPGREAVASQSHAYFPCLCLQQARADLPSKLSVQLVASNRQPGGLAIRTTETRQVPAVILRVPQAGGWCFCAQCLRGYETFRNRPRAVIGRTDINSRGREETRHSPKDMMMTTIINIY